MTEGDFSKRDLVKKRAEALDEAKSSLREWREVVIEGEEAKDVLQYRMVRSRLADYKKEFHLGKNELLDFLRERRGEYGTFVRVLDYGCGNGQALRDLYDENVGAAQEMLPLELVGVSVGDARTKEEQRADAAMRITYIDKKFSSFAPGSNSFDVILSRWTFDHLFDPLRELRKLYNALRPGGKLYLNFTLGGLAEKFLTMPKEQEDGNSKAKALDDALECIRQLRENISIDRNFIVTKTNARMEFPNIRYVKPIDHTGRGLYRLVRDFEK